MPPDLVVLDVSGHKYTATKATLNASPYFRNLLGRWSDSNRQEDGSYSVDADADTFQHILNFMRRPARFPLFWTKENGFDFVLYSKLEAEADYFLLEDLRDWIRRSGFQEAIKIWVTVTNLSDISKTTIAANADVETFFGTYLGLNRRSLCGRHPSSYSPTCSFCEKSLRSNGDLCSELPKELIMVARETLFNGSACVNEGR